MAPNPVLIPRQPASHQSRPAKEPTQKYLLIGLLVLLVSVIPLAKSHPWIRQWFYSGTAIESFLLVYGSFRHYILRHDPFLWFSLILLNFSFVLSTTSWLLQPLFITTCYLAIILTCLIVFPAIASLLRQGLRSLSLATHIFEDKIGFLNVPALEIDTEVSGRFVVRGITFSFLDLSIEAHGLELGLRLNNDVEAALCADLLTVRLFRDINITDVYGNIKVDSHEMIFSDPENGESVRNQDFRAECDTISAPAASSESSKSDMPDGAELSNNRHQKGGKAVYESIQGPSVSSSDDSKATSQYENILERVRRSSQIYTARAQIERGDHSQQPGNERAMRQAVCAKLQSVPSISHTPSRAVKVSVLQTIFPRFRKFLHRLPLLLRLLLNPLSYFHPIYISSISVAGPGERLKGLVQDRFIKGEAEQDADMKQLEEEMSSWLSSATFCLEMANVAALGHVPVRSTGDITTYFRSSDVSMHRTPLDSNTVTQITHLGGVDATVVIPAFLLPHHEHCLPPGPVRKSSRRHGSAETYREDLSRTSTSNEENAIGNSDVTEMTVSIHASLPTSFSQSMLDFATTFMKATKLIDLENLFESETEPNDSASEPSASSNADAGKAPPEPSTNPTTSTTQDEQNNSDSTSSLSKMAHKLPQSWKSGMKKALKKNAVGDKVNDRWISKTVGKLAARLEEAKGDFGYTTTVSLSLKPYRDAAELPSKILP